MTRVTKKAKFGLVQAYECGRACSLRGIDGRVVQSCFRVLLPGFPLIHYSTCCPKHWSYSAQSFYPSYRTNVAGNSHDPEANMRFVLVLALVLFVAIFIQSMVGVRQVVKRSDLDSVISDLFSLLFTGAAAGHAVLALTELDQQSESAVLFLLSLHATVLALLACIFIGERWQTATGLLALLCLMQYSSTDVSRSVEIAPIVFFPALFSAPLSKIYNDNFG
eukprot:754009-Hanusia_phi.AAC.1